MPAIGPAASDILRIDSVGAAIHRFRRAGLPLLVLSLLAAAPLRAQQPAPAAPAPAPAPSVPEIQVVVLSWPPEPDAVSVAYAEAPPEEQIRQDLGAVAAGLGLPAPPVRITREAEITAVEAKLPGLANWGTGEIRLDPLIQAFRRYGSFRVTFFFGAKFPVRPMPEVNRPPLSVIQTLAENAVHYDIRIDQSRGVPADVPTVAGRARGSRPGIGRIAAASALVLLGILVSLFLIFAQRRAGQAREGKP